ncbi:hypothetical protein FHR32_005164 [Streptosporangium album]|uniref:Uncharacterized protein n=1 Tax=Streptosporangium album TaxID=47479 RepID=A0A7W7RZ75_9ACTN|nr:hypothetical protein [Streptosporangium album]MBB4940787.1 hypothetical protein [Streptosporangium album]
MNATEIAAQIARLSALLPAALTDENWDGDIAAVIGHLADAQRDQATGLDHLAEATEDMDGPGWDTVTYETGRASSILATTSCNLRTAQDAAQAEQAATAAAIEAARAHLPKIVAETRGSGFFTALAALPGSYATA